MNGLANIAMLDIAGYPLVVWFGVITLTLLLSTAVYGYGLMKGKIKGSIATHMKFAGFTILIAIMHAILAISIFL